MLNTKKIIYLVTIVLLIIVAIIFIVKRGQDNNNSSQDSVGKAMPIEGRTHVTEGTEISYNSNPPTSGNHWPQPAEWGIYLSPLPDEQLVHNLEHGGIWISYKDLDDVTITKLGAIAKKYPQAVIITPRSENKSKIALASWGRLDTFDVFDEERIEKFIKSNINNAPEPQASLEQTSVGTLNVGTSFPDFTVTEVYGSTITKATLRGIPTIVWFTTSWCTPCQIGAKEVSKLDNELGGKAFDVLVIFVDPKEKNEDLVNWRSKFANQDWMVAFDNDLTSLAKRVNLKFLDSKFLLDKDGIIKNIDFKQADDKYLDTIRGVVREN